MDTPTKDEKEEKAGSTVEMEKEPPGREKKSSARSQVNMLQEGTSNQIKCC